MMKRTAAGDLVREAKRLKSQHEKSISDAEAENKRANHDCTVVDKQLTNAQARVTQLRRNAERSANHLLVTEEKLQRAQSQPRFWSLVDLFIQDGAVHERCNNPNCWTVYLCFGHENLVCKAEEDEEGDEKECIMANMTAGCPGCFGEATKLCILSRGADHQVQCTESRNYLPPRISAEIFANVIGGHTLRLRGTCKSCHIRLQVPCNNYPIH